MDKQDYKVVELYREILDLTNPKNSIIEEYFWTYIKLIKLENQKKEEEQDPLFIENIEDEQILVD